MDFLLKNLSPRILLGLMPIFLVKIGNYYKNKDDNTTGPDDAFGNVLISMAPALSALDEGNDRAMKKALVIVRDTITNYLNQ